LRQSAPLVLASSLVSIKSLVGRDSDMGFGIASGFHGSKKGFLVAKNRGVAWFQPASPALARALVATAHQELLVYKAAEMWRILLNHTFSQNFNGTPIRICLRYEIRLGALTRSPDPIATSAACRA
jgi:hypothetical protein